VSREKKEAMVVDDGEMVLVVEDDEAVVDFFNRKINGVKIQGVNVQLFIVQRSLVQHP